MSRKQLREPFTTSALIRKTFSRKIQKQMSSKTKTLPPCKGHDIAWIRYRSRAAIAGKDRRMRISIHFLQYGEFIKRLTRNQALRRNALVKTSEVVSAEKGES